MLAKVLGLTFLSTQAPNRSAPRHALTQPHESKSSFSDFSNAFHGACGGLAAAGSAALALRRSQRRPRPPVTSGWRKWLRSTRPAEVSPASTGTSTDTPPTPLVLVVNLDRSPARWESAKVEFAREDLKVERFPGTDGKAMTHEQLREVATWSARWFCTKGMVGCFMSHRRIWQKVVDDDLPAVVVLEDDVRLVDNFKARLGELMSNLPEDWEVCLLGAIGCVNPVTEPSYMKFYSFCSGGGRPSPGATRTVAPGVFVPHRPAGTHAYMVSKRGAKRLLEELPKACYHVDLTAWALPKLKLYAAAEQLATQDFEAASTVSKAGEPITQRFLRWAWTVTGLAAMGKKGGVPNLEWAWKAALFAVPVPFSGGKRVAVEMGPMSSVWVLLCIIAAVQRSRALFAFAILYQGLCCGLCRYLANTKPYLFFLGHLAVAAGVLFA